jgi:hypothetical protein
MFVLLLTTLLILYFSWISDWNLESESYLPLWLLNWSNCYFNLRTAVLFVACGFLWDTCNSKKSSDKKPKTKVALWFRNSVTALVIVCLAEGGHVFVLNRHPDLIHLLFVLLGSQ